MANIFSSSALGGDGGFGLSDSSATNASAAFGGIGAGVGLAASAYGAYGTVQADKAENTAQTNVIGLQQQQEALRLQATQVQGRRMQMQQLRQAQQGRAQALANATNQGAGGSVQGGGVSSGLAGGQAAVSSEAGTNLLGINQNLQTAQNMFSLNAQISGQKIAYADAQLKGQEAQGISSFGSALGAAAPALGKLAMLAL